MQDLVTAGFPLDLMNDDREHMPVILYSFYSEQ